MTTVLVTGATGNVGSAAVRELLARGARVRAFVRDEARAREQLGPEVELAPGDFADAGSLARAVAGVERVLVSSGDGPEKVAHEAAVIESAQSARVRLVVKASTVHAEAGSPLPPFDWNGRAEDVLRASGLAWTVLQSSFYMTNLLAAGEGVREQGAIVAPAGEGAVAMIDPRDVGAVAAAVLTGHGHEGRSYVLTGPEAVSWEDAARAIGDVLGREIAYVDVPPEAARARLEAAGLPPWLVEHLDRVFGLVRANALARTTETVRLLTGREPRSFDAFARDHAAAFAPASAAGGA